ncbi:hypothetical protein AAFF_G00175740 [Aldrovandia affinis]|uniref:Uncharacterized protein n=1 Tax=Aldrovandia affinis TaxID=143900 RepID=A0AAD7RL69_9TELE|nr:hypothetical protein AAFF_G00175740 [Aldrovandia affinis]
MNVQILSPSIDYTRVSLSQARDISTGPSASRAPTSALKVSTAACPPEVQLDTSQGTVNKKTARPEILRWKPWCASPVATTNTPASQRP